MKNCINCLRCKLRKSNEYQALTCDNTGEILLRHDPDPDWSCNVTDQADTCNGYITYFSQAVFEILLDTRLTPGMKTTRSLSYHNGKFTSKLYLHI